jgi:uncharacterized delta-60 repeat protein
MRLRRPVLGAVIVAAAATTATPAFADTAALDPGFGNGGLVATPFTGNNAIIEGAALDGQGRIVAGGQSQSPAVITLARYLPGGTLDPSFGGGTGKVTQAFGPFSRANGVAVQSDGKILVAASANNAFVVLRLLDNGTPDPGFNGGLPLSLPGAGRDADSIAEQPDHKILVAGAATSADHGVALARLMPGGALDPTFDGDGMAIVPNDAGGCGASASSGGLGIVVLPDGNILVGASCGGVNNTPQFAGVVRFNGGTTPNNGALDTSFGFFGAAVMAVEPSKPSFGEGIARAADGKIVETVQSGFGNTTGRTGVIRWNPDGSPDTSFGSGGKVVFDVPGITHASGRGVVLDPAGRIIVGIRPQPEFGFALAGLTNAGSLDPSFAPTGSVFVPFGTFAGGETILRQPDGKVVSAGDITSGANDQFGLARFTVPPVPGPPGASGGGGSGSGTGAGSGANQQQSGAGAAAAGLHGATLSGLHYDGRKIAFTVRCPGPDACAGTATLTRGATRAKLARKKHKKRKPRTVTIGSARFSVAGGQSARGTMPPTRAGKALLRTARSLGVTVTLINAASGERTTSTASVTRAIKKKHKRRR